MPISLTLPSALRKYSDNETSIQVDAKTVKEAFEAVFERHAALRVRLVDERGALYPYLTLYRNGAALEEEDALAVSLEEGDKLQVLTVVSGGSGPPLSDVHDVRMRGFRERSSVEAALAVALEGARSTAAEELAVTECAGRVLAESVISEVDVPPFRRSAMDGYAVLAEDTFGASLYDPIPLRIVGESMPGARELPAVRRGEACRIMTGARVPEGADAVLMAEDANESEGVLEARAAVAPGKNVGRVGEDVARGVTILERGRWLRPQDVGLLASVGHGRVRVHRRPRVVVLVSGNELLAPGEKPRTGFIVDSNTPMLAALVERDGGEVVETVRLPDDRDAIRSALVRASESGADVLLVAGGSSVGREDHLPTLVRELGELPVHGIAIRPASPTGIGRIGSSRVFLLPGNPVSCLCAYDVFARPALRRIAARHEDWPYRAERLPLAKRITSEVGRVDYVRVEIKGDPRSVEPLAIWGASVLSSTTRADGFVIVPAQSEGLADGDEVLVYRYDPACEVGGA